MRKRLTTDDYTDKLFRIKATDVRQSHNHNRSKRHYLGCAICSAQRLLLESDSSPEEHFSAKKNEDGILRRESAEHDDTLRASFERERKAWLSERSELLSVMKEMNEELRRLTSVVATLSEKRSNVSLEDRKRAYDPPPLPVNIVSQRDTTTRDVVVDDVTGDVVFIVPNDDVRVDGSRSMVRLPLDEARRKIAVITDEDDVR